MIALYHHKNPASNKAYLEGKELMLNEKTTFNQLQELALSHPDEWIGWCTTLDAENKWEILLKRAQNKYTILSKGAAPAFLAQGIDYLEDTAFINFNCHSWYPTWIMSEDLGIIHASILQEKIKWKSTTDFCYDLNLFTRIVQDQGAFCYSNLSKNKVKHTANGIYKFVAQTKKKSWLLLLLLCHIHYERRFPLYAFAKAYFTKHIDFKTDLKNIQRPSEKSELQLPTYEVIIPTMGRPDFLKDVLKDLAKQTILPNTVIIVEQHADLNEVTALDYLIEEQWPFKVNHKFIHQTGACNARNLALGLTTTQWVLFFDDDNRFEANLVERIFGAIAKTKSKVLNMAYLQKDELETQETFKQWPYFGSGCSMVHRDVFSKCGFDMALEHGYGEDVDYGMQIRNAGYDVIYAPQIQILHLKAPIGGFRKPQVFPWTNGLVRPKPSPQIMYYRVKNFTMKQLQGYKLIQFFKSFGTYATKNPFTHYKRFTKAWNQSKYWASHLKQQDND